MKFALALIAAVTATADEFDDAKATGGLCVRGITEYKTTQGDCTEADDLCCYVWSSEDPYWTSEFRVYTNEGAANTYCINTKDFEENGNAENVKQKDLWEK